MPLILPFDGHLPRIDPTAWIAPNATLIGNVTIGAHASVWYGVVMRGDMDAISLGENSNIQDNSVVHTDTGKPTAIGANVSVGHGAIVHGATVDDGVLIGMAASLLNLSHVGEGALIAAGALVLEGQQIPAGMLAAGVPAKVRGELDQVTRERVRLNSVHYLELAAAHAALP